MSHHRMVYVIDQDLGSRRVVSAHLARLGAETWPFSCAAEFLDIADRLAPACILLDIDGGATGAMETLAAMAAREPAWPVIATSARIDVRLAVEAMKIGARDVLEKPLCGDALAEALSLAWEELQQAIVKGESRRIAQEQLGRLTPRELEIALALLAGQANKNVAHGLGISVRTVEMHRAHIMAKLGVRSLAEAALIAAQVGLMPLPRAANEGGRWSAQRLPAAAAIDAMALSRRRLSPASA